MVNQTRHWIFTVNNWTAADEDVLIALGSTESYIVWGYETGLSGTPHLQGYVVFERVKRFSEAQRLLPEGAHLEVKRGSPQQASDYCKKDGLFKEFGILPSLSRGNSQFDSFVEWIVSCRDASGSVPSERDIANHFPLLWLRYERKLRQLALYLTPTPEIVPIESTLRPWQNGLFAELNVECSNDREIIFYVDEIGGAGKSFFQRYMYTQSPDRVQLLSVGRRDDLAHAIDPTKEVFLFNVGRQQMEFFPYAVVEALKDRVVFSPKYDSTTKILAICPHVVVFCNEMPDMRRLTDDRYDIRNIDD